MDRVIFILLISARLMLVDVNYASSAEVDFAPEYRVKAAFLYNFARFVEWPSDTFEKTDGKLVLCVLGKDPFGDSLGLIKGKTISGRKLIIKKCKSIRELDFCHILFISSSEKKHLTSILSDLKHLPVLTISEVEGFAQYEGIIGFIMEEHKVRFEINVNAADRAGLKISSKLLQLAKIIREKHRGEKD